MKAFAIALLAMLATTTEAVKHHHSNDLAESETDQQSFAKNKRVWVKIYGQHYWNNPSW